MKKSLVALAVLGAFAGAASAQSSVTLYGIVDAAYTNFNPKTGTLTDQSTTQGINGGVLAGNRWGIRGSESLGGGLSAFFTLEQGFTIDDGQGSSTRAFHRVARVGFKGGFGEVSLGRMGTFSSGTGPYDKFGQLDPFRTGVGTLGFQATMNTAASLRVENAIFYDTPANLGGFGAGFYYSFRAAGQEVAGGASNNNRVYGAYVNFASGPFYAVATYDDAKLGEIATPVVDPKEKHINVGGSWDFKVVKVSAAYSTSDNMWGLINVAGTGVQAGPVNVLANPTCGQLTCQQGGADATAWALGAVVPFGPHRINASYQMREVDAVTTATGSTGEAKRNVWALGYEYSFSRRTTGYVYYGSVEDKDAYKLANWGGAAQGFIGVNHTF